MAEINFSYINPGMNPVEVSAKLRRIADIINKSEKPDRSLVAADIKQIVAAIEKRADVKQIRDDISHATDGPVTDFVLISRAMEAVKAGSDPDDAANALYEELDSRGFLKTGDVQPSEEY